MAGDEEFINDDNLIALADYESGNNLIYLGLAEPSSLQGDPAWQIRKFTYIDANMVSMHFANGSPEFNAVWDDRESLTYS